MAGYDSSMAAFLRQMGVSEQNIYAEARQRSDQAQRQYQRSLPAFAEQERSSVQGVQDDAESRGVFSSGDTVKESAIARNAIALQRNEALAASQDAQDNYMLDAQRRIAELRQRAAEQELASRTSAASVAASSAYGG